ncbi:hypothetical protein AWC05_03020 [Mycobacterium florentinum]|uniref:Uncharacterized protein n=1 Tax=Mycobacterium florentinum TaxID=292462 RepID=A0A1X1TXM4_MYCFL|nr:hypothetical protein [Mycobacterium florentinum]MCV7413433.1 hypothetical protein [Mycobacterium florentinum]ORV49148.1 hypothetical protein AWC05_03020 [Mycobacterium florentinum]
MDASPADVTRVRHTVDAHHGAVTEQAPTEAPTVVSSEGPTVPIQLARPGHRFWTKELALALAGMLATLITAVTASYFAYQTSVATAETVRKQSDVEFARNERKSTYTELLAKMQIMVAIEQEVDISRYNRDADPLTEPAFLDEIGKWESASLQLSNAAAAVDLVGSASMRLRTLALREANNSLSTAYAALNTEYLHNPTNRQKIDATIREFDSRRTAMIRARVDLIDEARADLGMLGNRP